MGNRRNLVLVFVFLCVLCYSNGNRQADTLAREILKFIPDAEVYERCEKEKGAAVFDQIHAEWQESVACITNAVPKMTSSQDLMTDLFSLHDIHKLKRELKNTCNIVSESKNCFRNSLDEIMICLTDKEKKNVKTVWDTVFAGADFLCRDNGAKFIDFLQSNGVNCYFSRQRGLEKCKDGFMNFVRDTTEESLMFNTKNCKVIEDTTSCLVKEMSQCSNKNASIIVQDFFHTTVHKLPCDIYRKNVASLASCSKWIFALVSILTTWRIL